MGMRDAGGALGRRGLLAGAAALVAGGLAKLAGTGRAEAAHDTGGTPEVLHAGVINTTANTTVIVSSSLVSGADAIMAFATNRDAAGVHGRSGGESGDGVVGVADGAYGRGVAGSSFGPESIGVWGSGYLHGVSGSIYVNTIDPDASGVLGEGNGAASGVLGTTSSTSPNATGVFGLARLATVGPTVGVWGRTRSTSTGAVGTFGESINGSGVRGLSGNGNGVFGVSTNASGVYGFSNLSYGAAGASNVGVGVYASSGSNWGLHASSPIFAGVFSGAVYVNGNFTVANGAKSAAVKNKRGEHRRVYCQESPEPWFEDFGRGELKDGRAVVTLDPEFDAVVKGDDYMVFPVPEGDCRGLYVSRQGPHRFEVRELQGGTSSLPFSYRVVARRLDDVGRRLEKVDVPDFSKVARPVAPPDPPTRPEERGRHGDRPTPDEGNGPRRGS